MNGNLELATVVVARQSRNALAHRKCLDWSPRQARNLVHISRPCLASRGRLFPFSVGDRPGRDLGLSNVLALLIVQYLADKRVSLEKLAACDRQLSEFCRHFDYLGPQKKSLAMSAKFAEAVAFNSIREMPTAFPLDADAYIVPISDLTNQLLSYAFPPPVNEALAG